MMNAYKTPSLHTFTIYGVASGNRLPRIVRLTNMRHWTDLFAGLLLGILLLPAGHALGQTAAQARLIGVVTAVDAEAKKITLKTDAGAESTVMVDDASSYLRVPPGEKDLKKASAITLADLAVGDRVLARGRNGDGGTLTAATVIVMTKGDIAKKQAADRAEWQKRGVAGTVTEVNAEAKEITIKARGAEGPKPLRIQLANGATLRRYAPDSVKFADAVTGTLADIKVGDQVRAIGEKSQDGAVLTADELVSGTFRNIAGTVISVDADGKSVKITDLDTKKPVVVRVNADSNLRRMPAFAAQMFANRNAGGAPGGAPAGAAGGGRPGMGAGGPGGGMGGGMGRGGAFDMQQMLERMPALALAELKAGDALIIASTAGSDSSQVTAITLLAGVEPILTATPAGNRQVLMGSWNLDMNMNAGQ
jgi:Cu/Ag efflux protein CusF